MRWPQFRGYICQSVPCLKVLFTMAMLQKTRQLSALLSELSSSTRFASSWAVRTGEPCPAVSDGHKSMGAPFDPPARLLMGPGPANAHPRVLAAQCFPLLGHMHPPYFKIMDEVQEGLRYGCLTRRASTPHMAGRCSNCHETASYNLHKHSV
jgi:hypothetical protein